MAGNGLHRAWTLLASAALLLALVATAPVTALSPTACRVRNLDTGTTRASLQKAVGAARAGDRLTVRGTCRGTTRIGKDLTIRGVRTVTSKKPILDGAMRGTVVVVRDGVRATLRQLTVRRGVAQAGGAILNQGTLVLRDVIVRASTATYGGGVYNYGTLTLKGSSSIRGNATVGSAGASYGGALPWYRPGVVDDLPGACGVAWQGTPDVAGGGVLNGGTLILSGSSSIRGNRTDIWGGGVYNAGILTLNDTGSISRNTAGITGGGVYNEVRGTLTMAGSSSISSNTATAYDGGGVCNLGDLNGVVCGDNVHDNTPDECAP